MIIAICGLLAMTVTAVALIRRYLTIVTVRGESMTPTYRPGDRLLARRWGLHRLRRGDVVVLDGARIAGPRTPVPGDLVLNDRILKRVTALPGDPVPYSRIDDRVADQQTVRVLPRHIVVLGDNPMLSADSRVFGPVDQDHVRAVVIRPLATNLQPSPDRR
ncbi:S26 family signal peptidase [Nonomuraea sp. NBC_00507]|uniref:S26 family signal peptidase n=1 Tax=Nonomuraea sp. NBC_00507 TaxID=2976002 RepID=UPI002E17703C